MSTFDLKSFMVNEGLTRVSQDRKKLLKEFEEDVDWQDELDGPDYGEDEEHYNRVISRLNWYLQNGIISQEERDDIFNEFTRLGCPRWYDTEYLKTII